jgi:sterol desaturase/sphingolipid hydroxylase (fatty acid hydroxylase superfamily)
LGVPLLVHVTLFWGLALSFTYLQSRDLAASHKIPNGFWSRTAAGALPALATCWRSVVVNQLLVSPLVFWCLYPWSSAVAWGWPDDCTGILGRSVAISLFLCMSCVEVGFYYSHRLLHHPRLFGPLHRWHHEFRAPVAAGALYCHPVEHVLCNLLPVLVGPILCGMPWLWATAWFAIATVNTVVVHSGYGPLTRHDAHHARVTGNYGVMGVLDWWHGTEL